MAKEQAVWGIDMGRCALKAVKLRASADGLVEVLAVEYIEHDKILSQPDAEKHELIAASLEKFLARHDLSRDRVALSVPGQHTLARFTKLPPVAPKRIPDIVRYEADQQIPFDMDEVIWDYQTFQTEGMPDIEVGIFAMKKELLREHLLHFEQAAVEPALVQSVPQAIYNAGVYDGLLGSETTVLLDIGAENTDLVVATPNGLWTRTIPLGGNAFTESLVKGFKLSFSKAEGLKRTAETSKYRRQIFQAMRPIFADLVQELQRSIGFYSSTHRDAEINKIVCLGNAFKLPGLQKYLQQNLGMDVESPTGFNKAAPSSPALTEDAYKNELLSFYAAYGLAIQALDLGKVNSNLLPTELAKQAVWRKKRPAFAAAAACLVLAGGAIWFRQSADMRALAASGDPAPATLGVEEAVEIVDSGPSASLPDRAKAVQVIAAGQTLKKEVEKLKAEGKKELEQAETLHKLMSYKPLIPRVLKVVHDSVPVDDSVLGRAQSPGEVVAALAGAPPRGERKQLHIEFLDMQYEADLKAWDWPSLVEMPPPINPEGTPLPGIFLKILCTTPNQGGAKFINDQFIAVLRQNGRKPGMGFYFDRISLFNGGRVSDVTGSSGDPRRTPGAASGSAGATQYVDPITHESSKEDFRFEVYVDVVIGDLPEQTEEAPEGDAPEGEEAKPEGEEP